MTTPTKPQIVQAFLVLTALALSLCSLSSTLGGLAWLFMSLAGFVAWLDRKRLQARLSIQALNTDPHPALPATRIWLLACLAAFVLMAIATAYWGGPWSERHAQWRLMIGALGLWCLLRYCAPSARMVQALATAAAISSLLAYGLVITSGSSAAPTNRIPWMAGLALLSCSLLTLSYSLHTTTLQLRQFWLTASALMMVTALLSGVRGSWPLVLIWPILLWRLHGSAPVLWRRTWKWLLPLLAVLLVVGGHFIPNGDTPSIRINAVVQETGAATQQAPVSQVSSSGIRLALYKMGMAHVLDHPWLGSGPVQTKQLIKGTLTDIGAHNHLTVIGHMHNDLLHPWLEFGLFGLSAYLAYATGLAIAARHLARTSRGPAASSGLLALLVMHLSTGMTNMNFAHNYYPLMLTLSTALVMMGYTKSSSQTNA